MDSYSQIPTFTDEDIVSEFECVKVVMLLGAIHIHDV